MMSDASSAQVIRPWPVVALVPITLIVSGIFFFGWLFAEKLPVMKCDPTTLKAGMTEQEVISVCGEPSRSDARKSEPWYPLTGDTREGHSNHSDVMLVYGDISSHTHNVNLYIRKGVLDSVQIYGDYK